MFFEELGLHTYYLQGRNNLPRRNHCWGWRDRPWTEKLCSQPRDPPSFLVPSPCDALAASSLKITHNQSSSAWKGKKLQKFDGLIIFLKEKSFHFKYFLMITFFLQSLPFHELIVHNFSSYPWIKSDSSAAILSISLLQTRSPEAYWSDKNKIIYMCIKYAQSCENY